MSLYLPILSLLTTPIVISLTLYIPNQLLACLLQNVTVCLALASFYTFTKEIVFLEQLMYETNFETMSCHSDSDDFRVNYDRTLI